MASTALVSYKRASAVLDSGCGKEMSFCCSLLSASVNLNRTLDQLSCGTDRSASLSVRPSLIGSETNFLTKSSSSFQSIGVSLHKRLFNQGISHTAYVNLKVILPSL